jgi:pimeloyl-ACP methyl ester carboxylesterase
VNSVNKYGSPPYLIALLHGGPGAAGEMKPVADILSKNNSIIEPLQTEDTIDKQVLELFNQLSQCAEFPVTLIGYSWGAWLGFIFAARYPKLVKKLILISSGSFEEKYNIDLMNKRLSRLNKNQRLRVQQILNMINNGIADDQTLCEFGKIMTISDSYSPLIEENASISINLEIHKKVWEQASELRRSRTLIKYADTIECPVYAIHGKYDSHPVDGVQIPLTARLKQFEMICIDKCGHTPWIEKYAKDHFFNILINII